MLENLRLRELIAIVRTNEAFYDAFITFLQESGYATLSDFLAEPSDEKALSVITSYLSNSLPAELYNGLGRPYPANIARWFFLAWVMRDAPTQRLAPLLISVPGASLTERRAYLLNEVRKFIWPLLPQAEHWTWPVISEVLLARLEGSRRALRGTRFENIVRQCLRDLFATHHIMLQVSDQGARIGGETFDVVVIGPANSILIPVKTRETMGGGHALLFTRDIGKAITVAKEQNYICFPIIIAESWSGNLEALGADGYIYINANPNQLEVVTNRLQISLEQALLVFTDLATGS